MNNEPTQCPICHCRALKSSVEGKLDVRVDCPRCKKLDIDYRSQVNLADLAPPPNAAILSGLSRYHYESERGLSVPRLVWVEVPGNHAGRYEFQNQPTPTMLATEKCDRLFQFISEKVERTPGEVFTLHVPADLSLAFAKSENEFDSYLSKLQSDGLISVDRHSDNSRQVMVTGGKAKVIDVQYTESGHLSQLATESREDAIRQDVEAMKWLVRNFVRNASADLLTFELDEQIRNANTFEDICNALDHLQARQQGEFSSIESIDSSIEAHELVRPAEPLEELSVLDREVLRVAGNLLIANADARFASRISVPKIFESLDHTSGIAESVRVLGELGYFHGTDHEHPRFIMMSKLGFRRYLEVFRPGYATDLQKLRVAIVRGGKATDLDFAIMTELPRPIVEHALIEFADEGLIQVSSNNMHTRVCDISTRIRLSATG